MPPLGPSGTFHSEGQTNRLRTICCYTCSGFSVARNAVKVEDHIQVEGVVTRPLGQHFFEVALDNGHLLNTYLSGKMKKHRISLMMHDRVLLKVSQYDLKRGMIFRRL